MPWVLRSLPHPHQWLIENDPRREEMVVIQDSDVNDATLFKRARFRKVIEKLKEKTKGALGGILGGLGVGLGMGRSRSKSTGSVNLMSTAEEGKVERSKEANVEATRGNGVQVQANTEVTPTPPAVSSFPGAGPIVLHHPTPLVRTSSGAKKVYRQSMPVPPIQSHIGGARSAGPSSPSPSQHHYLPKSPLALWGRFNTNASPATSAPTPRGRDQDQRQLHHHPELETPRSGSPVENVLLIGEDDEARRHPREELQVITDVPTGTPKPRRASATALLTPPPGGLFRRLSSGPESPTTAVKPSISPMGQPKYSMESMDTATSASASVTSVELRRLKTVAGVLKVTDEGQPQQPGTPKSRGWLKRWGSSRRRKGGASGVTQPLTPLVPPGTDQTMLQRQVPRRSVSALESGSERGSIIVAAAASSSASVLRYRPSTEVFTDDSSVGARSNISLSPIAHHGGLSRSRVVSSAYQDTDDDLERVSSTGTRISFSFSDDSDEDEDVGEETSEPNAMAMTGAGGFPVGMAIRNRGLGWEPLYPRHQQSMHGGFGHSPPAPIPSLHAPSSTTSSPGNHSPLGIGGPHGSLHEHSSSAPSMTYSYSSPSSHSPSHMHSMHSQLQLQHPHPRQRSSNLSLELLSHGVGGGGSFHANTTSSPSPLGYQSFPGGVNSDIIGAGRVSLGDDDIEEEGIAEDAEDEEEEEFLEVKRKPYHEATGESGGRGVRSARMPVGVGHVNE